MFRPLNFTNRVTLNLGYTQLLKQRLWKDAERSSSRTPPTVP
jgi:hypothetical protein